MFTELQDDLVICTNALASNALQTLRIPLILSRTGPRTFTNSRPSPAIATTLSPMSRRVRARRRGTSRGRCSSSSGRSRSRNSNTQSPEQSIIRRLFNQILIPWQRSPPSRKRTGHPGVLIGVIPDCKSDTARGLYTRLDQVLEIGGLLRERRRRCWQLDAYIDFCVCDFHAQCRECLEDADERALSRDRADLEVALEADAVDFGSGVLDQLDDRARTGCFGAAVFEVVVVVVELDVRVCGRGCGECDGDV